MIITNFKNLAKNSLREKALLIAEAGYEAIDIEKSVFKRIKLENNKLKIIHSNILKNVGMNNLKKEINLNNFKKVFIIGIGKGSALASLTLAKILGKRLTGGIALDIQYYDVRRRNIEFLVGTHPLPSKQNIVATKKIIKLVKNLGKDDLLITFICGGGSALLCGSEKEMKNSILATKLLTQAGANILELNTVRKHLSEVKGGGLAKMAYPATVTSLIVSDVLGNDLSMVASGPTVFNKTTKKDAEKILKKYLCKSAYLSSLINALAETPKVKSRSKRSSTTGDKKYFTKVKNILFLSNREPIMAMDKKAKELGFKSKIYSYLLRGEAKNSLLPLIKNVLGLSLRAKRSNLINRKGAVILAGGETTVSLKNLGFRIKNLGKGGRNMEAVLGALNFLNSKSYVLNSNLAVMSFASDGHDNTEAAGAIGDILTIQKAQKLKLNPQEFLENHNSFNFFKKTGDLIFTKQKTFNVADLMLVLKLPKE